MRTLLSIAIIFGAISFGFAQQGTSLKGPAAKNSKPWKQEFVSKSIVTSAVSTVQGPEAKNIKVWNATDTTQSTEITIGTNKNGLMGPAAKNYKPWKAK